MTDDDALGADGGLKNNDGQTAVEQARLNMQEDTVAFLSGWEERR